MKRWKPRNKGDYIRWGDRVFLYAEIESETGEGRIDSADLTTEEEMSVAETMSESSVRTNKGDMKGHIVCDPPSFMLEFTASQSLSSFGKRAEAKHKVVLSGGADNDELYVNYGEAVRLRHISGKYICGKGSPAQIETENKRLDVSPLSLAAEDESVQDSSFYFAFRPKYRIRHSKDKVRVGDYIYLEHVLSKQHMRISPIYDFELLEEDRYEANLTISQGTSFQVFLYDTEAERASHELRYGEYLTIAHQEYGGLLTFEEREDGQIASIYTMDTRGGEVLSVMSLWQVESMHPQAGGEISWKDPVLIKNVYLGKYLCVEPDEITDRDKESKAAVTIKLADFTYAHRHPDKSLWDIKDVDKNDEEFMKLNSQVRIQHLKTKFKIHVNQLSYEEAGEVMTSLEVCGMRRTYFEDVYKVATISEEELQDIFETSYVMGVLDTFLSMVDLPVSHIKEKTRLTLTNLILNCTTGTDIKDPLTREGIPVEKFQNLLVKQKIVDKVVDVCDACKSFEGDEEFRMLLKLGYRLLRQVCLENKKNGRYMLKFFDVMMSHLNDDVGVEDTLNKIFYNNRVALESITTEAINQFLSEMFEKGRNAGYVRLLATLCEYKGIGFQKNQKVILEKIEGTKDWFLDCYLDEKEEVVKVRVPVVVDEGKPEVDVTSDEDLTAADIMEDIETRSDTTEKTEMSAFSGFSKFTDSTLKSKGDRKRRVGIDLQTPEEFEVISLKDFVESGKKSNQRRELLDFFNAQIHLFASLCVGRYEAGQQAIEHKLPFDMVIHIMQNVYGLYSSNVVAAFVRVSIEAFLDRLPVMQATNLHLTRIWGHGDFYSGMAKGLYSSSPQFDLVKLEDYVLDYLKRNEVTYEDEISHNELSISVIALCQELLTFAYVIPESMKENEPKMRTFFSGRERELFTALIRMLDGSTDAEEIVGTEETTNLVKVETERALATEVWNRYTHDEEAGVVMTLKLDTLHTLSILIDRVMNSTLSKIVDGFSSFVDEQVDSDYVKNQCSDYTIPTVDEVFGDEYGEFMAILRDLTLYENTNLATMALETMTRLAIWRREVTQNMHKVQFIFDVKTKEIFEHISVDLNNMDRLMKSQLSYKDELEIKRSIKFMIDAMEEDETPTQVIQNLLLNLDAPTMIHRYVKVARKGDFSPTITVAYLFFAKFCENFRDGQEVCFSFMKTFLEDGASIPTAIQAINAVLHDNSKLCEHLTKGQIKKVVNFFLSQGHTQAGLDLLKTILVSEGKPVVQNQVRVVNALFEKQKMTSMDGKTFLGVPIQGDSRFEQVLNMWENPQQRDDYLKSFLRVIELLGECCEGNNPKTEPQVSMNGINFETAVDVATSDKFSYSGRATFVDYLKKVYLLSSLSEIKDGIKPQAVTRLKGKGKQKIERSPSDLEEREEKRSVLQLMTELFTSFKNEISSLKSDLREYLAVVKDYVADNVLFSSIRSQMSFVVNSVIPCMSAFIKARASKQMDHKLLAAVRKAALSFSKLAALISQVSPLLAEQQTVCYEVMDMFNEKIIKALKLPAIFKKLQNYVFKTYMKRTADMETQLKVAGHQISEHLSSDEIQTYNLKNMIEFTPQLWVMWTDFLSSNTSSFTTQMRDPLLHLVEQLYTFKTPSLMAEQYPTYMARVIEVMTESANSDDHIINMKIDILKALGRLLESKDEEDNINLSKQRDVQYSASMSIVYTPVVELDALNSLQNTLNSYGAHVMLLKLSTCRITELENAAIEFGIALMIEGNSQVQDSIIEYLKSHKRLRFFENVRNRLLNAVIEINDLRREWKEEKKSESRKSVLESYLAEREKKKKNKGGEAMLEATKSPVEEEKAASFLRSKLRKDLKDVEGGASEDAVAKFKQHSKVKIGRGKRLIPVGKVIDIDYSQMTVNFETIEEYIKKKEEESANAERKTESSNSVQLLKLLQNMCEGHNLKMQDYLRHQGYVGSIDIISECIQYLRDLVRKVDEFTKPYIDQVLETLTEVCQGPCTGNQVLLVNSEVPDSISKLLTKIRTFKLKFDDTRTACVTLLLAMMEGNDEEIVPEVLWECLKPDFKAFVSEIISSYEKAIKKKKKKHKTKVEEFLDEEDEEEEDEQVEEEDIDPEKMTTEQKVASTTRKVVQTICVAPSVLFRKMMRCFTGRKKRGRKIKEDRVDEQNEGLTYGFALFILFKQLEEYDESGEIKEFFNTKRKNDSVTLNAVDYYNKHTARIEILRNDKLERVYFRKKPTCKYLRDESKRYLISHVNRDSPSAKIEDFFSRSDLLISEMTFAQKLGRSSSRSRKSMSDYINISFILALAINIVMLGAYTTENEQTSPHISSTAYSAIIVLGAIQLVTCIFLLVMHTRTRLSIDVNRRLYDLSRQLEKEERKELVEERWWKFYLYLYWYRMTNPAFSYHAISVGCSIVGLAYSPFFFSFHLLSFIFNTKAARRVIKSVALPGKGLLVTAGLAFIILYIYTLLGFVFLRNSYQNDGIARANDSSFTPAYAQQATYCRDYFRCYLFVISSGLDGVGLHSALNDVSYTDDSINLILGRFFYDFSFYVIMIILVLNAVLGLIVDSFSAIRDRDKERNEDQTRRCFICGIEDSEFDRNGDGFKNHIKEDQNMWNYLFFIHYLKFTDETIFTGQESFVYKHLKENNPNFFPIHRAITLEEEEEEEEEEFDEMQEDIKDIQKYMKKYGDKVEQISKKLRELNDKIG